jgi:hypothetical protein
MLSVGFTACQGERIKKRIGRNQFNNRENQLERTDYMCIKTFKEKYPSDKISDISPSSLPSFLSPKPIANLTLWLLHIQ